MMKNFFKHSSTVLSLFVLFNLVSCIKNNSEPPPVPPAVNKCDGQPGTQFTAVKAIITQRCVGCHNSTVSNGGLNFTVDCNIINAQASIKAVAVDQNIMPPVGGPLSATQKTTIASWISAGGTIKN